MPTYLHNPRLGARERYFRRQSVYRLAGQTKVTEHVSVPFFAWCPDLPPRLVGWRGYRDGRGLILKSFAGQGLFLTTDDGFLRIDPDRMVGGVNEIPAGATYPGWGAYPITMLGQYVDANRLPQRQAIISGNEGTRDCLVVNLNPANDQWRVVTPDADLMPANPERRADGNREALWDFAVYPFGCQGRLDIAGNPENLQHPVMIFCNADEDTPVNIVYVTPAAGGVTEYTGLHINAGASPAPDFKATSCESFDGRMHYLATVEVAAFYPQRHRWSAIGTAIPQDTIVGSGYLDFGEFQGRGLRIESMRDNLVIYFEDGVLFQIPTGLYSDAYRPQVVSRSRGLLGTHAMCAISPHLHFGIFTDGWWTLDSSGRWAKLGRIILEESQGKSHEYTKWEETFYNSLDYDYKHRIVCTYDSFRQLVRISYTSKSGSDNRTVLNYHWPTDSCWKDSYDHDVSMWGNFDVQSSPGVTWGGLAPQLWSQLLGSWGSYAPSFVENAVVHGNTLGLVFMRDPDLITYDSIPPAYGYRTHTCNRNSNPLQLQSFHRLGIEYLNVNSPNMSAVVSMDNLAVFQNQAIQLNEGATNTVQTAYAHYNLTGSHHEFWLAGMAPIMVRSIIPELILFGTSDPEGQV